MGDVGFAGRLVVAGSVVCGVGGAEYAPTARERGAERGKGSGDDAVQPKRIRYRKLME